MYYKELNNFSLDTSDIYTQKDGARTGPRLDIEKLKFDYFQKSAFKKSTPWFFEPETERL